MLESVFILSASTDPVKTASGTLVDSWHVITCAHVLRDAGYAQSTTATKTAVSVQINGQNYTSDLLPSPWLKNGDGAFPSDDDLPVADDVVVLRLREELGKNAKLRTHRRIGEGALSAFGITDSRPDGVETKFTVGRVETRGVAQLVWDEKGVPVERGFSGGPVYDDHDYIIGIIVSRWLPEKKQDFGKPLAYMIPIDTVAATVKNIEQGFELRVESPLFVDYPSAKDLFEWCWNRLRRTTLRGTTSRDLLELGLLVSKAPIEDQRTAVSEIEQLHSGSRDFSHFDRKSSSELLEDDRQFLYLRAPGGSGKSFYLYRLVVEAVHSEIVPFFIDVRELSKHSAAEISAKLGGKLTEALDNFINDCGIYSGAEKFRSSMRRNDRSLLLVDGLNETTVGFEQIMAILQAIPGNYDHISVIAADRLAHRAEYPRGFRLATMEPVSDKLIADALKRDVGSDTVPRILKLPFFLDLYVQDSSNLAGGKRGKLVLEFVRRSLSGHDAGSEPSGIENQLNAISEAAFRWYEKYERTVIKASELELLLPEHIISTETMVSSGLILRVGMDADSRVEFRHQLIQDYLAARHFVRAKLPWSAPGFKILTLDRQSADVLVFVREMIEEEDGGSSADSFIIQVYDWDYGSALSCLQLTDERSASRPIGIAISALVAEKAYELFLHSRQTADTQLPTIKKALRLESRLPDTIQELTRYVADLKQDIEDELFDSWRDLYISTGSIDENEKVLGFLVGDHPLMGWTAANVIRRLELTPAGVGELKMALRITGKNLSPQKPTPVRWRIYHAFGTHYSSSAVEILWKGVWDPAEHEDTSYGAARSLVELAFNAPTAEEGANLLGRIANEISNLTGSIGNTTSTLKPPRSLGAFRKCAILKSRKADEPAWWDKAYLQILDNGIALYEKLGSPESQRWQQQKRKFLREDRLALEIA